jgi:hypothetical protein
LEKGSVDVEIGDCFISIAALFGLRCFEQWHSPAPSCESGCAQKMQSTEKMIQTLSGLIAGRWLCLKFLDFLLTMPLKLDILLAQKY